MWIRASLLPIIFGSSSKFDAAQIIVHAAAQPNFSFYSHVSAPGVSIITGKRSFILADHVWLIMKVWCRRSPPSFSGSTSYRSLTLFLIIQFFISKINIFITSVYVIYQWVKSTYFIGYILFFKKIKFQLNTIRIINLWYVSKPRMHSTEPQKP